MKKKNETRIFRWDIAITLCKQDIDYARKLVKHLNPRLKVFFYENSQEEIISKSGPEIFAKIFKEHSRVVVILSRKEWSETFYTDIERNAIIDRTKSKGYHFLLVLPMAHDEAPIWYPSTQIYVDPYRFTIEEVVRFIEFKLTDEGGTIKPITFEDRYQNLLDRIEAKKAIIQMQQDEIALQNAKDEVSFLKDCFNNKCEFLRTKIFGFTSEKLFSEYINDAVIGMENHFFICKITIPDERYTRHVSTQDYKVSFELFQRNNNVAESIEEEHRLFYYSPELMGWSVQQLYSDFTNTERPVLFKNRDLSQFYDLSSPIKSLTLIDDWFQKLLSKSTQKIQRHI